MEWIDYLWEDKKRILGLPIGFTWYRLSKDRLFFETGPINIREEDLLLYRITDLQLNMTIFQRFCRVGTISVFSTDKTTPHLDLENIANPREVKELIHQQVEDAKLRRRMRVMEVMGPDAAERTEDEDLDDPSDIEEISDILHPET